MTVATSDLQIKTFRERFDVAVKLQSSVESRERRTAIEYIAFFTFITVTGLIIMGQTLYADPLYFLDIC